MYSLAKKTLLLLLLALTPFIEERAVREGFPLEYAALRMNFTYPETLDPEEESNV